MSSGVRIRNLPQIANENLIISFLQRTNAEIEGVEIKNNYADVFVNDMDDIDSILMLDGHELLGFNVEITKIVKGVEDTDPDIVLEEVIQDTKIETPKEHNEKVLKETIKEEYIPLPQVKQSLVQHNSNEKIEKIENSQQLRVILQEISLKTRRELDQNDSFRVIMDSKIAVLVTMFTLIVLTFVDIFGY